MTPHAPPIIPAAFGLILAFSAAASLAQDNQAPPTPEETVVPRASGGPALEVRATRRGDQRVEEYRLNNRLYMVKITPDQGEPYYLVDGSGGGRFSEGQPRSDNAVPMWVIKEFSLGGGANKKRDTELP